MRPVTPLSPLSRRSLAPVQDRSNRRQHTYLDTRVTTKHQQTARRKKSRSADAKDRRETKRHLTGLARQLGERRLADRLQRCHSNVAFLTCGQHTHNYIPNYVCEFRLCPNCGRRQAKKKFNKYHERVLTFAKIRRVTPCHLVLTQERRKGESLQSAVARLIGAFKKFRRRAVMSEYFSGGLWSVEFTWDGEAYHAHLHCLVFRRKFVDVDLLRAEWTSCGGGQNLRLDRIDDLQKGLREVLKYIAKPVDVTTFGAQNLRDVLRMKGKRFFGTFGEFHTFSRKFDPVAYAHILDELEVDGHPDLQEGMPCPDCGETLFEIRQSEDEHIAFLRLLEVPNGARSP